MQISSRFTIAVQILTCIDVLGEEETMTSEYLASSVNVNPVIIRKIIQQLKAADLITVRRGAGGASFARPKEEITLLDVFYAVESLEDGQLFHFHDYPNPNDLVGNNIHRALDDKLQNAQSAMEQSLKSVTIADVIRDIQGFIEKDRAARLERRSRYDF